MGLPRALESMQWLLVGIAAEPGDAYPAKGRAGLPGRTAQPANTTTADAPDAAALAGCSTTIARAGLPRLSGSSTASGPRAMTTDMGDLAPWIRHCRLSSVMAPAYPSVGPLRRLQVAHRSWRFAFVLLPPIASGMM
jgi:hypothetical protein